MITVCVKVANSTFLVTNKRTKWWAELSRSYLCNCFVTVTWCIQCCIDPVQSLQLLWLAVYSSPTFWKLNVDPSQILLNDKDHAIGLYSSCGLRIGAKFAIYTISVIVVFCIRYNEEESMLVWNAEFSFATNQTNNQLTSAHVYVPNSRCPLHSTSWRNIVIYQRICP